jgi:prepilin-type N-terminal cleavage/methylation domain-containing protein
MSQRGSRGFTLVEVLIAIALIVFLIVVFMPAVLRVQAAAARAEASNNLRQIGLALHNYDDAADTLLRNALLSLRDMLRDGEVDLDALATIEADLRSNSADFEAALDDIEAMLESPDLTEQDRRILKAAVKSVNDVLIAEDRLLFLIGLLRDDDRGGDMASKLNRLRDEFGRLALGKAAALLMAL